MSKLTIGWLIVIVAGLLEVLWPIGIKYSQNFTRWGWIALTIVALTASFILLGIAVSNYFGVPVGTAYAVWTGIGAAGAAIVGIMLFGEPLTLARVACLCLIIGGVVGLKLTHEDGPAEAATSAASDHPRTDNGR